MRLAWLLIATLTGCGAHASGGPAWPKMAEAETDGGESLAPQQASVIPEVEKPEVKDDATSGDGAADAAKVPDVVDDAGDADDASDDDSDLEVDDEDMITGDEIVIEIDDDE